ncbi:MAG TPA: lytic murein transglycosylase [Xanthobacteraceae bacterium]|jgi:lytic murein transglycosylase|nr:lytic murein transglycosylase [Xanthobacteraceae bacterium]
MPDQIGRRRFLGAALGAAAVLAGLRGAAAASFSQWVENFRAHARARGVSDATYTRVMSAIKPDTSVYALDRAQPEFTEEVWQYLNRRVSDWRIITGKERAKEYAPLLARVEQAYAVDRYIMLGLWGIESAYGDVVVNLKLMRPVIPALAALAWGERRRRRYWEQELLNALVIVERGWAQPKEMIGSWAGAMGHTQWMPEVWLHMGVDFNGDGRISPYGSPDDALAGTARYLLERGKYKRGVEWGCEIRLPSKAPGGRRTFAAWKQAGVVRADGEAFAHPDEPARLWRPVPGGPVFLLTRNFFAVKSYNPSNNYTLAIVHLADRIRGAGPFVRQFPGGERTPTIAEVQEIQRRLTALGFNTGGADGRVGNDTMVAVRAFQRKAGLVPADGYAGLKVLAKLRQGG